MNQEKSTRKYWLIVLTILIGLGIALAMPGLALAQRNLKDHPSSEIRNNPTTLTDDRLLTTEPNFPTAGNVYTSPRPATAQTG
jgi:hypothetical protein